MVYRSARTTLTFLVLLLFAPYAAAEEVQLKAAEIEELLAGNTISGTWSGTQYKQFFEADGLTVYVPEGGSADEGKWRVDPTTDSYESWWEATGWVGYQIDRDGDTYYWVDGDGGRHPFVVLEGKQVSW